MNTILNELPRDLESICRSIAQNRNYTLVREVVERQIRTRRQDALTSVLSTFDLVRGYVNHEHSTIRPEIAEFLRSLSSVQLRALIVMLLRDPEIVCTVIECQMQNYVISGWIFSRRLYNSYTELVDGLQRSVETGRRFDAI